MKISESKLIKKAEKAGFTKILSTAQTGAQNPVGYPPRNWNGLEWNNPNYRDIVEKDFE